MTTEYWVIRDEGIQAKLTRHPIRIVILHDPIANWIPVITDLPLLHRHPAEKVGPEPRTIREPVDFRIVQYLELTPG